MTYVQLFLISCSLILLSTAVKTDLPLISKFARFTENLSKKIVISDGIKSGIASGLAAAVVKGFLQPLDTIKTVQQAQKLKIGPLRAGLNIVKERGILGLWSGTLVNVFGRWI